MLHQSPEESRAGGGSSALDAGFAEELCARLSAVERIDAAALAELFALSFSGAAGAAAVGGALQSFLARRTLRHAFAHVPFYRDLPAYGRDRPVRPEGANLGDLPTVTRAIVMSQSPRFIADDVHLRSVCHSSGTTGSPIEIYKSHEEVAFIRDFFTRLFAPAFQAPTSLSLSFPTPHHGAPLPFPSPGIGFVGGVTDDTLIRDAVRILATEYQVDGASRRISRLSGMGFQLLFFTNYLLEQGLDPAAFRLQSVSVAGGFVPRHWRNFLARAWGCAIHDRFSLTETAGGATRCDCCGLFRPDPQVLFEVLDVDGGQVLTEGVGKLVVTNLYPFAQMMPLIRYETGDVVRLGVCPRSNMPGFAFLGRLGNCVSAGAGREQRWLLFSAALHELLAEIPDLNVYEWFSNVRAVKDRTVGSLPMVAVKHGREPSGRPWIRLEAELRYTPHAYPDRTQALADRIRDGLAATAGTTFGEDLARGDLAFAIDWRPPGGLTGDYVIKI